jgi:uncharacterized protein
MTHLPGSKVVQLELKDIKSGGLEQEFSCEPKDFPELLELAAAEGPVFHGPISFSLRFQRSGQLVEVDGNFSAAVRLSCGRCLEPYIQALDESFALTFAPRPDSYDSSVEVELEAEQLGLVYYDENETLCLHDPLQEQLLLAIPISPLCREDCRGLCHECGEHLNEQQCDCVTKSFNNKFSVLAELKLKQ